MSDLINSFPIDSTVLGFSRSDSRYSSESIFGIGDVDFFSFFFLLIYDKQSELLTPSLPPHSHQHPDLICYVLEFFERFESKGIKLILINYLHLK